MKVILKEDISKKGLAGDVIKVADGYARNYLLPRGIAIIATPYNLSKVENIRKNAELARLELENKYKAMAAQLTGVSLAFIRKADDSGKLFGSVSENDISEALAEKEIEIHKSFNLKNIGEFDVQVAFPGDINSSLKVVVEKEQ